MTLDAAPFLRKVASWGLPGVHDLPREIPLPYVNTGQQAQLSELIENGAWDRDGYITDVCIFFSKKRLQLSQKYTP